MIPSEQRSRLLRRCQEHPRSVPELTHGQLQAHHIPAWIGVLVRDGLLERIGEYYLTSADGREELARESASSITPSRSYGNFAMPAGSYVPPTWRSARPGADSFRSIRSVGGC